MKISARNILSGKVQSVDKGKVVAIVKVELKSGNVISSIITNDSVDRLGLKTWGCSICDRQGKFSHDRQWRKRYEVECAKYRQGHNK